METLRERVEDIKRLETKAYGDAVLDWFAGIISDEELQDYALRLRESYDLEER